MDLDKAFYSIPRDTLYRVLETFGIPPKMQRINVNLHSDFIVKIQSGDFDVVIATTGGVEQGCTMAPILILIYMQAAIEVINAQADYRKLQDKTREDHLFAGRLFRTKKDVKTFEVLSSPSADEGAIFLNLERNSKKV